MTLSSQFINRIFVSRSSHTLHPFKKSADLSLTFLPSVFLLCKPTEKAKPWAEPTAGTLGVLTLQYPQPRGFSTAHRRQWGGSKQPAQVLELGEWLKQDSSPGSLAKKTMPVPFPTYSNLYQALSALCMPGPLYKLTESLHRTSAVNGSCPPWCDRAACPACCPASKACTLSTLP